MANPEDDMSQENGVPDGRPRRQPPIIDVKAVEISADGTRTSAAGSDHAGAAQAVRSLKQILASLASMKLALVGSVCVIAGVAAGAFWIYLISDGIDAPAGDASRREAAVTDEVMARIGKLEAALQAPATRAAPGKEPDKELESRVAALDAVLAPLAGRIAELERGIRDAAAAARTAGERADRAAGQFDAAKKSSEELNSLQRREQGAFEDIADRLKLLESAQTALQQKQDELVRIAKTTIAPDKAVRVAMVAAALRSAVERDGPFTAELAAARSLGVDATELAALAPFAATGVPTRNELFRDLSALLPELLRVSVPAGRELGYLDRLQASAVKMMNIRPVRDEPGDDPAAVISRIEFKMVRQDMAEVVAELDKLPAPAKELAQPWRAKALARQHAIETVRRIVTASLAKLGEPAGSSAQ